MAKRKPEVELTESHSLSTPTGLSVYAVTGNTVRLVFNPLDDVDGVHVERSKDGEVWKAVDNVSRAGVTDNAVEPGHTYHYRAYSIKDAERSAYTESIVATTTG